MTVFEEMSAMCPKCGEKTKIMWFPAVQHYVRRPATTGGSEGFLRGKSEKVQGKCTYGYIFKPKDLD